MLTNIFAVIQLVLKLMKLWDQFLDYADTQRKAEAEARRQRREKAIEDAENAKTEEEAWDAQKRIIDNDPLG